MNHQRHELPAHIDKTVKLFMRDEIACRMALANCGDLKEQCEMVASLPGDDMSKIAWFDLITVNRDGTHQWTFFAYYGHGCDSNDRGWCAYGGFTRTQEQAESECVEFKRWFSTLHSKTTR